MRKSLFSEFFYLCAAILFSAVICIGTALIIASANFYKADKRRYLDGLMNDAAGKLVSCANVSDNDVGNSDPAEKLDFAELERICVDSAGNSEIVFTLVDPDGAALVCSEAALCSHKGKAFDQEIISLVTENGLYELSTLENYYKEDYFNIAYPINLAGDNYFLFGRLPCQSFTDFLGKLATTLVVVTVIMIALVFCILYMSTRSILDPIREMTIAARRFGEGDFSKKLRISEDNELGFLAGTLNEMANSLAEIEETRKSFISNVSHELKTPMTTIGGFIDGILDGTIPPEKQEHYLKIVSSEVTRLARLVRSMLNISKYEAGELTLVTEEFDIITVILPTLLSFENRIAEKNVDIRGLDVEAFTVNADRDLMQQIIYNLTENAVKFVNKGGYIEFAFKERDDMRCISIRNSGEGLKKNEISKVFERFYKTDESRGIDPTGFGLGLSIVRSLVNLHGGTILVRSEPDQYVEFEFSLKKSPKETKEISESGERR